MMEGHLSIQDLNFSVFSVCHTGVPLYPVSETYISLVLVYPTVKVGRSVPELHPEEKEWVGTNEQVEGSRPEEGDLR